MTRRYILIRTSSPRNVSSRRTVNPQNRIRGHVFSALGDGKASPPLLAILADSSQILSGALSICPGEFCDAAHIQGTHFPTSLIGAQFADITVWLGIAMTLAVFQISKVPEEGEEVIPGSPKTTVFVGFVLFVSPSSGIKPDTESGLFQSSTKIQVQDQPSVCEGGRAHLAVIVDVTIVCECVIRKKIVFRIRYDMTESLAQAGVTSRQKHLGHTLPAGLWRHLFVLVHSEPCSSRVAFVVLVYGKDK
jgi:hypothetical protein